MPSVTHSPAGCACGILRKPPHAQQLGRVSDLETVSHAVTEGVCLDDSAVC